MGTENSSGALLFMAVIAIALFGGIKNVGNTGPVSSENSIKEEVSVEQKIQNTQTEIDNLKKQLQIEEDKKTQSQYKGIVTLSYINRSKDPSQEYVTIKVRDDAKESIPVTGWVLRSINTENQVSIPKATYLLFTGMLNVEESILLNAGDTLYLTTGISPNGASFRVNKCSGYLGQFQTFIPYFNNNCPAPRNEDLSSIPKLVINSDCLDYIDSMSSCRIQTATLPINWGSECKNFILNQINYPSCINTHKNDKDFYEKEWRVYLRRSESLWKDKREIVVLYDSQGKIVDTLKY